MGISANIKKLAREAINADNVSTGKWVAFGAGVATEYTDRDAVMAVKADMIKDAIIPAMGDDAIRVMTTDIPDKRSERWAAASETQRSQWLTMKDARVSARGKAEVYFNRVLKYAFPAAETTGDTKARTDDATYCTEHNTLCIKRLQKSETPPKNTARVLALYAEINKLLTG